MLNHMANIFACSSKMGLGGSMRDQFLGSTGL